jgi:prepilin-type N-terminal cleavage/methylation domain-containing protein
MSRTHPEPGGFTLVELLISILILVVLIIIGYHGMSVARDGANQAVSTGNLRALVMANFLYESDHGTYAPATDARNRTRWHGGRNNGSEAFDPSKGYLSPYLGESRRVGVCPQFKRFLTKGSFEEGSGGYGYNAIYIGGTPRDPLKPNRPAQVPNPARTLMFATTALAKADGVQEYPFADPRYWVDPNGNLRGKLQPTVHFRFRGKALIAWCDGHISTERPEESDTNYYGGDNKRWSIGFFGPAEENGYWNPKRF